jgi:hypothetical protein
MDQMMECLLPSQEKMEAMIKAGQEEIKVTTNDIRFELKETINK